MAAAVYIASGDMNVVTFWFLPPSPNKRLIIITAPSPRWRRRLFVVLYERFDLFCLYIYTLY